MNIFSPIYHLVKRLTACASLCCIVISLYHDYIPEYIHNYPLQTHSIGRIGLRVGLCCLRLVLLDAQLSNCGRSRSRFRYSRSLWVQLKRTRIESFIEGVEEERRGRAHRPSRLINPPGTTSSPPSLIPRLSSTASFSQTSLLLN